MTAEEFLIAKGLVINSFTEMMAQYKTYANFLKGLKAFDLPIGETGPQYLAFSESLDEWLVYIDSAPNEEDFKHRWGSLQSYIQRKSPELQPAI